MRGVPFVIASGVLAAAPLFSPPRTGGIGAPALPSGPVWIQGLLVADISAAGEVTKTTIIHAPGPIGPAMASAVAGWPFAAAIEDGARVGAPVLVAAIVRPPSFPDLVGFGAAMEGSSRVPRDVPAPIDVQAPAYPPLAVGNGVVVIEISVDADGKSAMVVPLTPASGFDAAAIEAARQWTFRPAERNGVNVPGCVYVMFGFVSPVANLR